ncbi:hypothetical protein PanWU01x14_125860 [Parasponia andersonii]|uniref:Uncharacterized protein n=1 Tax=Parasponia andersonii TaxID=3476 RepID=A0A2P5CTB0_PARAD|nr:hypothetical protein PanWU01x14_125860 [Parasponia andersonii]
MSLLVSGQICLIALCLICIQIIILFSCLERIQELLVLDLFVFKMFGWMTPPSSISFLVSSLLRFLVALSPIFCRNSNSSELLFGLRIGKFLVIYLPELPWLLTEL